MIDLPLSVIAWLSVIVVQAVIHYVVLGSRRPQTVGNPVEDEMEETMSLATAETLDDADASFTLKDCGYDGCVIPSDPSTPVLMREKGIDIPESEHLLDLLDQTGTDIFKSRSVQSLVEEQIAIAQ
mmetsp:Transcript_96115/g.277569  ORF Transcript_96115/g.277569 Transcript_96115/m.277569 type:complete len:126 (-) Transcript_96115:364-741(-)|eukprot:CAMPEP_0176002142 /NCGR_PEP_ID=MMETSP0120_2-20121206/493_1 /TAXON_ID=160619 /ORGANISM="Kryptoperidinium foliaceum, Strain CCMP 1326" /LENGTH=125 /DNA_ID=CAMNT_0017334719 /DNA_START=91 /DNA_END=468 /DNA_ORIENTATION=+